MGELQGFRFDGALGRLRNCAVDLAGQAHATGHRK